MPVIKLIVDSGATKATWCLTGTGRKKVFQTVGMSPYFLTFKQMEELIQHKVLPKIGQVAVAEVHFYGTGTKNPDNRKLVRKVLQAHFPKAKVAVENDLLGAARSLCGKNKGVACILGTGSNSCYYDGKKIVKNSPGLGYVLGDEGSGAYLGKKVLQYFLYETFDRKLHDLFLHKYGLSAPDILENVYKKPLPNRFLASFALFLAENRGHYMIENIIEDGINDFFFQHLYKYRQTWQYPVHFIGSIAHGFSDVIRSLGNEYGIKIGKINKDPMQGLIDYHR